MNATAVLREQELKAKFRRLDAEHERLKRFYVTVGVEPEELAAVRREKERVAREVWELNNKKAA